MSNVIQYKGYFTNVEYSQEDQILFGKIEGIRDLVTFECENAGEVEQAFKEAVDDYLEFCEEEGKDPNKSFSGSFNVRVSPELHRDIWAAATKRDMTLNAYVNEALRASLKKTTDPMVVYLVPSRLSRTEHAPQFSIDKDAYKSGEDGFSYGINRNLITSGGVNK